jgi:hypothetical protein
LPDLKVRTVARDESASPESRLIVARGGGNGSFDCEPSGSGGHGGDSGSHCGRGARRRRRRREGGYPEHAGGEGAAPMAVPARWGRAATEADLTARAAVAAAAYVRGNGPLSNAGGGGGGSNLVPAGGTASLGFSGDPSIVISWPAGVGEEPSTEPRTSRRARKAATRRSASRTRGSASRPQTAAAGGERSRIALSRHTVEESNHD